ncbi:hypothetical protein [Agromyces sp. PvR057]|uniref:hypothetical protein n=1 Tax=Agromyces sp. PvR057 TaxID=3156403 RepID=UPI000E39C029
MSEHANRAEFEPVVEKWTLEGLREAKIGRASRVGGLSASRLREVLRERHDQVIEGLDAPVISLSARHPWVDGGRIDVFQPGRWDTEYDLVFMSSDFAPNSASIGYGAVVVPSDGTYLVAVRFSGHETTLRLNGPWGIQTGFSATTSDHPTLTAVWTGAAGAHLNFSFLFSGGIIGYLEAIDIHLLN